MREFDSKVVIVTGGAYGIGKSTALEFARNGANVVIADINEKVGNATVSEINELGSRGLLVLADVSNSADCNNVVATAVETFGRVDILFNNVGIQSPDSYFNVEDAPEELWDRTINVNLKSYFLMSKYSIPEIRKQGGGVIINTASVQGLQSMKGVPAYAASKGGILSLTRQMAIDYASENIRVLAICPGTIDTQMVRAQAAREPGEPDDTIEKWGMTHPLGRTGDAREVANVVLFLASEKASFMTGEYVNVDGGMMALGAWASGSGASADGSIRN
ncbi:MAG: SDR family NAD(P)-dependent oxidoreductase [SAR202 cluster bacterium]|jgi:NAD(P)-dependent dehydrogenase (short-subunit alcohol dehydrogenase family)|nr:SDR family oxidoreductase [Dehalococcoidia bacterium]MDP7579706.1 SDR family NAD(P)-dependent oxidoreductase [SAR202 cluster bacterium]